MVNNSAFSERGVVVSSSVGIGYDVPWRQVEAMLMLAASRTGGVRTAPEPYVLIGSLNTFDITYELNAYLEPGRKLFLVLAELNQRILDAFNEFGVQIMTPGYVADPPRPVVVPKNQWFAAPAAGNGTESMPGKQFHPLQR